MKSDEGFQLKVQNSFMKDDPDDSNKPKMVPNGPIFQSQGFGDFFIQGHCHPHAF